MNHNWTKNTPGEYSFLVDTLTCERCGNFRFSDWGSGGAVMDDLVAMRGIQAPITDINDDCDLRIVRKVMTE
jgi:hypothetical protein